MGVFGYLTCYLAGSGIYCNEDDVVYGMDGSDSRNERMVLKAVGHLGESDRKYNPMALSQLAAAWPASRTVPIDLGEIGAYSHTEGGPLMANASVLPFDGAQSLEVAYGAGTTLISNIYTAGRMQAFTRSLLYPTVVAIVDGLAATERLWLTKQSTLAADTSLPEARRRIHSGEATRSRTKLSAAEAVSAAPGDLYVVERHRGVLHTCEEDCPPPASSAGLTPPKTDDDGFRRGCRRGLTRHDHRHGAVPPGARFGRNACQSVLRRRRKAPR